MRVITNGRVVTSGGVLENGAVLIDHGKILGILDDALPIPRMAEIINASGCYVGRGFIDTHCHGGGGANIWEQPDLAAEHHLRHGTTGLYAGIGYNEPYENYEKLIELVKTGKREGKLDSILGIHFEGPFTNPELGYDPSKAKKPDPDKLRQLLDQAGGLVKLMTLAPELPGIDEVAKVAQEFGVLLSVGHSKATPEQVYAMLPYGLRLGCHLMCATGYAPTRGIRSVGTDEAVLACDELFAEVIPDYIGAHVRPLHLRYILKAKGADRVNIITDACAMELPEQEHPCHSADDEDINLLPDGLAGSRLTMDKACFNMKNHTGASVCDIFKMASANPAKAMGVFHRKGSLEQGKDADIVICDGDFNIKKVLLGGAEL